MNIVATTRVFIVDDQRSMRERLIEYLHDIEGVDIVGEAETPEDAIDAILRTRPDVVLLDYQLTGGTGLDVLRGVRDRAPAVVFAVLTHHATAQHRRACLEAGAHLFLDKATEFDRIRELVADMRKANGSSSN